MAFTALESAACQRLIDLALAEDLGSAGDVTSQAVIPVDLTGKAVFVAREPGVLAGLSAATMVFQAIASRVKFTTLQEDGACLVKGVRLAEVSGPMRGILAAERTALNFLQHMSGIATLTRQYVDALAGLPRQILDTRKTLPGWRLLEKYAVRCGGGHNHRLGLYDAILLKDNHLLSLANRVWPSLGEFFHAGRVKDINKSALLERGSLRFVEIEVENLSQLDEVLKFRPDIILLDNMSLADMREAVRRRNDQAPAILLEASGGVNLDTVRAIAETGVDHISVGALTHSAPALDIALDFVNDP